MRHAARDWYRLTGRARFARHVLAGLLALVVLTGIVRSGTAYIYCATMDQVVADACCALHVHARVDGQAEIAAISHCCSVETLSLIPAGSPTATRATTLEASEVAVQPATSSVSLRVSTRPRIELVPEEPNTGPPKPSDIPRRLRVFLI